MRFRHLAIFGPHGLDGRGAGLGRQQRGDDADRPARVIDMHGLAARVAGMDLDRGVNAAGRRAADQQGNVETLALHLGGDMHHLVERGRDEAGKADGVGLALAGDGEDLRGRRHHAKVDDLVIVAGENHADDVLADVMHVALDGREHDGARGLALVAAGRLLRLHIGQEDRHRLLHHAGRLDHLRQEHLSRAEQVADDIHARHQRALDHVERALGLEPRLLGVGFDEFGDPVDERMRDALVDGPCPPFEILRLGFLSALAAEALGDREQALGPVRAAVEHHVLAGLAQFRFDRLVDRELSRVDDPHVHARLDGVIEEDRVHGLAHRLVAAERERQVRDAARDMRMGQRLTDLARRLDEGDAVAVVLLDPGRNGEDVGVEDDVLGRKAGLFREQLVGARADRDLALECVGLALLVERHHHHRRAIGAHQPGLAQELLLAFLHRDRVDDRLALHAFEPGLDHREFRRIDHHRHARDIRLGGDEVEELDHHRLRSR